MALINCPECGREISNKAEKCPHCGCPKSEFETNIVVKPLEKNYSAKEPQENNPSKDHHNDMSKITFEKSTISTKYTKMRKAFGIADLVIGCLTFLLILTSNEKIIGNMRIAGTSCFFIWCGVLQLWGLHKKSITITSIIFYFIGIIYNLFSAFMVPAHIVFILLMVVFLIFSSISLSDDKGFLLEDLNEEYKRHKKIFWSIICIGGLSFFLFITGGFLNERKYRDEETNKIVNNSDSKNTNLLKDELSELLNNDTELIVKETPVIQSTPRATQEPIVQTYEDVFFYTLMDNADNYNGKYVRTVIQVYRCYQSEYEPYIQSQYSDSDIVEKSADVKIYPDNYQDFESGEYVTVEGILGKDGYENILVNAHITDFGTNSQTVFENSLSVYTEEYNQKLQQEKVSFIEGCVSVSYDELRKYPDTYTDKPIKLTIYAKDVAPDGWIFPGDIIATMDGEELAVYDDRIVREPRIIQGDTITVYAVGNGLATMKVKQKGLIFNKTIDEYEVPSIKIRYTENDINY